MNSLLKSYPVIMEIPVAWGEMDAFQHVNNVIYIRYFESIRIAYFEKINWFELSSVNSIGPILGSTSCRYLFPATYPDTIFAGARITEIKEKRLTMEYLLVSKKHEKPVAEGNAIVVSYDYKNQKSALLPESIVGAIKNLESSIS